MSADFRWWKRREGERLPAGALRHASRILAQAGELERHIARGGLQSLDQQVAAHQRANQKMGSKDRRLLAAAVYGFARNRDSILQTLPDAAPGEGALLHLALADALTSEAREGLEHDQATLSRLNQLREEWLLTILKHADINTLECDSTVADSFEYLFSLPAFWLRSSGWPTIREALTELSLGKLEQRPQLRVNTLKSDRESVFEQFQTLDIPVHTSSRSPWGVVLE